MTTKPPTIDELRDSFNCVYHGPDSLRQEYELVMEAEKLGVHIDTYRRLYELRGEEAIDPYPKPKKWWCAPGDWGKWVWHLPPKKKIALGRKGVVKLVQSGVIVTIAIGIGRYVWEAPKREKLAHYQAWQMINSATGQKTSGGRIDALQDLVKDSVSLAGLNASGAYLVGINLQKAILVGADLNGVNLSNANLSDAILVGADLSGVKLKEAILPGADLSIADLSGVNLEKANLSDAILIGAHLSYVNLSNANLAGAQLFGANLSNVNLSNTNLAGGQLAGADLIRANFSGANFGCSTIKNKSYCTNFKDAQNITPKQIKLAKNWQSACYDPDFRKKLGLPPQAYCAVKAEYVQIDVH